MGASYHCRVKSSVPAESWKSQVGVLSRRMGVPPVTLLAALLHAAVSRRESFVLELLAEYYQDRAEVRSLEEDNTKNVCFSTAE